ncbi:MAG: DUF3035 domain-containing protein [Alphaproteobacteria bacterium]
MLIFKLLFCMIVMLLTGCDVKNTLGIDHYRADEFQVASYPPLEMPKDYYNLQTPKDSSQGSYSVIRGDKSSQKKAKEYLFGADKSYNKKGQNVTDKMLIETVGKGIKVDPNIRLKVNQTPKEDDFVGKVKRKIKQNFYSIKNTKNESKTGDL